METTSPIEIVNIEQNISAGPLVLDVSYKGNEVTRKAAEILGLSDIHGWSVVDSSDSLAMVHYNDDADMKTLGHLRGLLLDLETKTIIADSFGYTPTANESQLNVVDNNISIKDQDGVNHIFSVDDVIIKRIFEGVVIRVIWHKNKCYRITHRKINPVRSKWGASKTFLDMYEEAGGPTPDQLFDQTKPYSNTCYDFLVVDQSLLVGTRQKVYKPYIVCLAQRTMDIKRPEDEVAPGLATFTTTDIVGGVVSESIIHNPAKLSIKEANHHLKFGYYNEFVADDSRQLTGEAIIIYTMNNGIVNDIVKVQSPSYEWRVNMRGNNPNIVNQFYSLLNTAYVDIKTETSWNLFKKRFILLPLYDERSLKNLYDNTQGILTIPSGEVFKDDYTTRESRVHLLWINFVLSLPPQLQGSAINILSNFKKDRYDVIKWLQDHESKTKSMAIESIDLHKRAKGIIDVSRKFARKSVDNSTNYSANGRYMTLHTAIKNNIRNFINKENGSSLYGLVREMKYERKTLQETQNEPSVKIEPVSIPGSGTETL